ncbi:MAG TPA: DUF2142 domain-containing protein, partial [Blastocatellia bacterium]|nr:DUF2142 domain-containing protein [Blastocatellia bacterium]
MGLTAQNLKRIAGFLLGGAARPKLAKHFMWLFWGIGLLYLLIVPPFQVPDEPGHLFRAYQISQGGILAQKIDNRSGGFVPASFALTFQEAVRGKTTGQTILFNPDEKYDLGATQRCLHIPLRTGDVTFASFPGDTLYSPVPFLPQATAILVARILHLPPVLLMYLARLANLIATGAVCTLAIWITPALRNVFFLVGLSPVFLSESASCSPDGLTNSVSMLLIAVVLKCAYDAKTRLDRTQIATLAVLSVVLALCKPAYFLLPLLYFIIPATKARTSREYYAAGVAILLLGVVAMSAWAAVAMPTYATPPGLVDLAESRGYAVAHPLEIGLIVARNLGLQWQYYVSSAFGLLGWLDTPMSPAIIVTFVFI